MGYFGGLVLFAQKVKIKEGFVDLSLLSGFIMQFVRRRDESSDRLSLGLDRFRRWVEKEKRGMKKEEGGKREAKRGTRRWLDGGG